MLIGISADEKALAPCIFVATISFPPLSSFLLSRFSLSRIRFRDPFGHDEHERLDIDYKHEHIHIHTYIHNKTE